MKPLLILTIFIACLFLVGPILLIPVVVYLAVGLTIFAVGTWPTSRINKSILRHCGKRLVFKDESIDVTLEASAKHIPPIVESGAPWNIVLVIDRSASMMGTALGNAKIAAKNLVSSTPDNFQYGIVEFQEYAHIRSQLTTNRKNLKTTINRITSGGGTAIHDGLRLAAQVLKHEVEARKKNAVILLSDGCSNHESALLEADNLTKQGVVIYSIGLGACDETLMKKIASDTEKYFYARYPKQLKCLYHTIGRIIQDAQGKEVEITEYPNVKKAPFHIFGWGDIQPSTFDFENPKAGKGMSAEWYLPALKSEHISLDYRLMSRCYGWYPVSELRAQLKLKDQEGRAHTFKSNKGPYVLVIPRFFLWQIFWIFLNPLFWIVLRKWSCKEKPLDIWEGYQSPKRIPIPQPEHLPALQPRFKLSINPTLVLGVGYGGFNALTHLKRLLWEHSEDAEVNKKISFAFLDTVNPWFGDTVKSGHVALDAKEKLNIHASVSEFVRGEAETEEPRQDYVWLNARQKRAEGIDYDTGFGTNLDRGIGRLMYLNRREDLHGTKDPDIVQPNHKTLIQKLYRENEGETLQVCIAGTLSGGSSSGVILELCYSIRRILDELNIPGVGITLFLMDYQVQADDARRDDKKIAVQANKDGFVNELARFFTARANDCSPLPGDPGVKRWFDRIVWVDKKDNTGNRTDLYPQCATLIYSWAVEKGFRELLLQNTQYIHDGLLLHRFEVDTVFFFKRTLESYYSVRLLLTTLGNLLLGLPQNPADYSVKSVNPEEMKKYIDDAFDLLYNNPDWKASLPTLLKNKAMALNPQPQNISTFLSQAGLLAVVDSSSQDRVNKFLDKDVDAFEKLLVSWIECLLTTHKDARIVTPREKKLPTTFFTLDRLKENFTKIRNVVEGVPDSADYLLKKRCLTVAEMCARFTAIIDTWKDKLSQWWDILGNGNEKLTGTCRALNAWLNDLKKSIEATRTYTTPHFAFDADIEDKIYQKYFAHLEHRILEQLHWRLEGNEGSQKIQFIIVDDEDVKTFPPDLEKPAVSQGILDVLLTLPAYFAAEKNKWHEASIREIVELTRQAGQDMTEDYFIPQVSRNTLPYLLYLNSSIGEILDKHISAGIERETVESENPLITGFFKYKPNHEKVSSKTKFDPDKLPAYVFSEEWNSYNALKIYSNIMDEEPLTPSYPVVALCRNMKKFLGAVHQGILETRIKTAQAQSRMVYRLLSMEVAQTENDDDDIINLLRVVVESKDPGVEDELETGYNEILKLDFKSIKTRMSKASIPFSDNLREQLLQITAGAVEYYKNLN
jgi:uncharacterized protein YegL